MTKEKNLEDLVACKVRMTRYHSIIAKKNLKAFWDILGRVLHSSHMTWLIPAIPCQCSHTWNSVSSFGDSTLRKSRKIRKSTLERSRNIIKKGKGWAYLVWSRLMGDLLTVFKYNLGGCNRWQSAISCVLMGKG